LLHFNPEKDLNVCRKSLNALIEFHELLDRKKKVLKVCMEIFYQKARLLLHINNLQIRSILFEKIFEPTNLDISSQEMTKERLKHSKTLNLKEMRAHHYGSYAFVFLANHQNRLVAAKGSKLSNKCLLKKHGDPDPTHFSYELEFLRSLRRKQHPNVIQLIDFDQHLECLVLEYMSFGSLRKYLLNRRSVQLHSSFQELISIAAKIASALNFLEKEGVIHLAVQARNVLVDNDGDVKLTGFQFCRRQERVKDVRNTILKPHFKWMDPQALLYQSVDPRTVSWSFGVFLYELLTYGCEPYSRIKRHTDISKLERCALDSYEARVYVSVLRVLMYIYYI
jgi:serine/threonine protein kinase